LLKPAPIEDVVKVNSNLIVVPVSVSDSKGQAVHGLKAEDFRLEEEGRPQQIAQIGDAEQIPLELAVLLDVSGSVKGRFGFEKEAATRFIRSTLKPTDRAVLFAIDSTPRLVRARADADKIAASLQSVEATDSPTAFYDTVVAAAEYLRKNTSPQHRRVILVISDGEDTFSDNVHGINATAQSLLRADAIFYSINPEGQSIDLDAIARRGQNEMQTLATSTGGSAFIPSAPQKLDDIFLQIAAELRSQYLLGYYAKTDMPKGAFLRIAVEVPNQPGLRIRARQGYYVTQN